jgi:hypothetical protein
MDETLGASLRVQNGIPSYEVEDEEGRMIYLLTYLSRKRMKTACASGAGSGRI